MERTCIIVMLKQPIKGFAKTRLAATVGEEEAFHVYNRLLKKSADTLKNLKELNSSVNIHLVYTPEIPDEDVFSGIYDSKTKQVSGDLGTRLKAVMHESFEAGYDRIIIMGTDCYDLSASILNEGIQNLTQTDVVFGPAKDGGYYLIGMNKPADFLFDNIDWSTERVLYQSIEKAKNNQLSVSKLKALIDIDTYEDLIKIPEMGYYGCTD